MKNIISLGTRWLLLGFCAAAFSGCAAFKANDLPLASDSLINRPGPTKIKVFQTWSTYEKGQPERLGHGVEATFMAGYLRDSITRSNCCDIVQFRQQADVVIEAKIQSYFTPWMVIPAMLNSGSLGLIPYWENRRYNVEVTATNVAGKKKSYTLSDGVVEVRWLPLIITGPFFDPDMSWKITQKNLTNNLVYNMQKDHFF
jgi:hypothetical protein